MQIVQRKCKVCKQSWNVLKSEVVDIAAGQYVCDDCRRKDAQH